MKHYDNSGLKNFAPVIWFTGLPCSGKTTLACALTNALQEIGIEVEHLDGDSVRSLMPDLGFTREARSLHLRTVAFAARKLSEHGITVIGSFITPYEDQRLMLRALCPNFTLVYLSTPADVCERRDVKGMYAQARKGLINNFTGVDAEYEIPFEAEIGIDTSELDLEECIKIVRTFIKQKGLANWTT